MTYTGRDQDRRYSGENADVSYSLKRCIHAKVCVQRLAAVFDPDRRPWILIGDTAADALTETVEQCPSGALHLVLKDGSDPERQPNENRVMPRENGPLYVHGRLTIVASGVDIAKETRAALCRCGASNNKPFCDNSHLEHGFTAPAGAGPAVGEAAPQDGSTLVIRALPGGPLHLTGPFAVADDRGAVVFSGSEARLCRCGGSASKPFCDGTHLYTGFNAEKTMPDFDLDSLQPANNTEQKRFEIRLGDDLAVVEYLPGNTTLTLTHTEVPPAFEGKGIAGKLAKFALDWAKAEGLKVNPLCPYVKRYIERHPEYQDNAWGF